MNTTKQQQKKLLWAAAALTLALSSCSHPDLPETPPSFPPSGGMQSGEIGIFNHLPDSQQL